MGNANEPKGGCCGTLLEKPIVQSKVANNSILEQKVFEQELVTASLLYRIIWTLKYSLELKLLLSLMDLLATFTTVTHSILLDQMTGTGTGGKMFQ